MTGIGESIYGGLSRTQRDTERRERLLEAALELFSERGYEAVTVAEVCTRARVSKRNFYEYFADREALAEAVHRSCLDLLFAVVAEAVPQRPGSPEEAVRALAARLVRFAAEDRARSRILYVSLPWSERRRRVLYRRTARHFADLIGRSPNGPTGSRSVDRLMLGATAGTTEMLIDWVAGDYADDPETVSADCVRFFLGVLAAL